MRYHLLLKSAISFLLIFLQINLACASADPDKVLRVPIEAADDGFDMVRNVNYYSTYVAENIFETMLTYDYMADPVKLVPLTAEAMPEVSDNGKTYIFRIKKGIYFTPDPAFKGLKRELTAADYAYTIKRFIDPANRSPAQNFVQGKIVGLDAVAEAGKKSGKFDYDAPVAGLTTPDRYTLKIKLNQTDYNFLYSITYSSFGAMAREVVEEYPLTLSQHPVGTGPYMLSSYTPRSKIILVANPDWRGFIWDFKSTGTAWDNQVVKEMKGKQMPQIGKVEISIIEEEQSRWLALRDKQFDIDYIPQIAASTALDGTELQPYLKALGFKMYRAFDPDITYTFFNFRDPVVGGYNIERIALRRAIAMAYNIHDDIVLVRMGQAIQAEMLVPRGLVGYDPNYRTSIPYNIPLANKLLDYFGYKRGADGYRNNPDGTPFVVQFPNTPSSVSQTLSEIWKRGMDKIGIRSSFPVNNFADNIRASDQCLLMTFSGAWIADYPDAEDFYQLFYGPNALRGNTSCYQSATYDALYDKAVSLPNGPERTEVYKQMNRQLEADGAMSLQTTRIRNWIQQPWILGFKKHPIIAGYFKFIDIDKESK